MPAHSMKNHNVMLVIPALVFSGIGVIGGSEVAHGAVPEIIAIEYLAPMEKNRDIETVNIDVNYFAARTEPINLSLYFSVTATYAKGSIRQMEGSLQAGTLREARYDNTAFGIGPGLLARFDLFSVGRVSAHLLGSGHLLLYSDEFPAGGDYYNFMWRGGPELAYKIGDTRSIGLSFQWTHVSNGQGLGPQNPSYEAKGVAIRFKGFF